MSRPTPPRVDEGVVDLDALRRLEPGAIDAVFFAYSGRLNTFLRRMGASTTVAEELVQEAFVRLVRHAPRLRDDTRIGAWLYTVTRNLWTSHRRWAWIDGSRLLELAFRPAGPTASPAELVLAGETRDRVEQVIAALPESMREVWLLVVGEGLEPAEAAGILGIQADAARQRLSRARKAVEEALA